MILENQGCQGKHLLKPNERKTSDKAKSASSRFTTTSILIQKRDFKIHVCGNKQTCRASTQDYPRITILLEILWLTCMENQS